MTNYVTERRFDPETGKRQERTRMLGDYADDAWTPWRESEPSSPEPVVPLTSALRAFTDGVCEIAEAVVNATGRVGVLGVTVTENLGLALGCLPGVPTHVLTASGMVEVIVARASKEKP
jgi:hypothetical protein